jgi:hypothetical protein
MTIQEIHYTRPVETEEYEIFDLQQQSKKDMCRKNRKKKPQYKTSRPA